MTKAENQKTVSEADHSFEALKAKAKALSILGIDRMSRDELLYEVSKAQGGDGGLTI